MSQPILPFAVWQSGTNENSLPANDNALRAEILNGLVISDSTTAQPGAPSDGDIYIIPAAATGAQWSTFSQYDLTIYRGGTWLAYAPADGIVVNVNGSLKRWNGAAYVSAGGGSGGGSAPGVQFIAELGSTADSDPGAGLLKWNNATQASATVLYLNDASDDGVSLTSLWPNLDAGGFLYLQHATDPDTWQLWEVSAVTDATGYAKLGVALRADGGAFADGDPMLVLFQNAGALTNWTEGVNTSSPNATIPVAYLQVTNPATNMDAAILPKGTGAIVAQIPDGTATGGNKRGTRANDLQRNRSTAAAVAAAPDSFAAGRNNTIATTADESAVFGSSNNISSGSTNALCAGGGNTVGPNSNYSAVFGNNNTASARYALMGGNNGTASGESSFVHGESCVASAIYGSAVGFRANNRGMIGGRAWASGMFTASGDAQERQAVVRRSTTNATPAVMTADGSAPGTDDQIVLPNSSCFMVRGDIVARENATGDCKSWEIRATIKRGANAASTAIVGTAVVTVADADAGAAAWTIAVTADTTNGALAITATGEASKSIKWVGRLRSVEVAG